MGKLTRTERRQKAKEIRNQATEIAYLRSHPVQTPNGDESKFEDMNYTAFGNYSKGLKHIATNDAHSPGLVEPGAYRDFVKALNTGDSDAFNDIPTNHNLGTAGEFFNLTNPQCGLTFDLQGPDSQEHAMPPAPSVSGEQAAAEMAELYWMAVLRDTPFDKFTAAANTPAGKLAKAAADDLNSNYPFYAAGGAAGGKNGTTTKTLFRGTSVGLREGNYISQFLLIGNQENGSAKVINGAPTGIQRIPTDGYIQYGAFELSQKQKSALAGKDYMLGEASWLSVQNGEKPAPIPATFVVGSSPRDEYAPSRRFITTPRDMATYVHFDALYEAYLNACWYLVNLPTPPYAPGNPYTGSKSQDGFGSFGKPHILSLVTEVATRALKCVWYQKWLVHRRLRPEVFGGRAHFHLTKAGKIRELFGSKTAQTEFIHTSLLDDLTDNTRLGKYFGIPNAGAYPNTDRKFAGYFLPMAFPEGSPTHPAYGAGHATVAAACVTVLKAFFKEDAIIEKPVRVKAFDPEALEEIPGNPQLTIGGELNKLAANVSVGRNMGGVHYWSDDFESRRLGEQIGIEILQEQSLTYNEKLVSGGEVYFTFIRMDGKSKVTIASGDVSESPIP